MQPLEILIIAAVAVGGVIGYSRGIIAQIGSVAAIIGAIIFARMAGDTFTGLVGSEDSAMAPVVGYGIAFLVAYLAIWLLARLLKITVSTLHLGIIDRVGGAIFKALQWALLLSVALNLYLLTTDNTDELRHPKRPIIKAAIDLAPATLGYLSSITNYHDIPDVISTSTTTETNE